MSKAWAPLAHWIHNVQIACGQEQRRKNDSRDRSDWRALGQLARRTLLVIAGGMAAAQAVAQPTLDYLVQPSERSYPRLTYAAGDTQGDVGVYLVADDPRSAGCYCTHSLPNCQGPISGRVVDECYPLDGISLQENVLSKECGAISSTTYDCTEVMGQGARCTLLEVDCCGVMTQSAVCTMN